MMNETNTKLNLQYSPNLKLVRAVRALNEGFESTLPLDIYEDLPPMPHVNGSMNGEALFKMIANAYPEGVLYPQCRANRRKLYMSILFLRTESGTRWSQDLQVCKGDYVENALKKEKKKKGVVGIQRFPLPTR